MARFDSLIFRDPDIARVMWPHYIPLCCVVAPPVPRSDAICGSVQSRHSKALGPSHTCAPKKMSENTGECKAMYCAKVLTNTSGNKTVYQAQSNVAFLLRFALTDLGLCCVLCIDGFGVDLAGRVTISLCALGLLWGCKKSRTIAQK